MRFGLRLTLFFAATLLVIQIATIGAFQSRLHDTLMEDGTAQVGAAETRFVRQLSELEEQLADGVRLLTLDFALRQAIADRDSATVVSALRNHGRRVGANRMLLVTPEGTIDGDTMVSIQEGASAFPYPSMLDRAIDEERSGSVAIMDGKAVWLVVVPVMAPDLIAFIAAALPLDDRQLARIRDIAGVPGKIGVVTLTGGEWRALAGTIDAGILNQLPGDGITRAMTETGGDETIVVTHALAAPTGGAAVRVVLDYPLSEILRRYQRVSYVLLPILLLGLIATLIGAVLISRGAARPIEILAEQTKRIAAGDYTSPRLLRRGDELGQLSVALRGMTAAIAERESSILRQATHDPVTGLANRAAVTAAIDAWPASESGALLVIGLIRWRAITSTVGREVGDRLLCEAATRIGAAFENNSALKAIGAIGESTFAVLLTCAGHRAALDVAARLNEAFERPYQEKGLTIDTPIAVGISLSPQHGSGAPRLLRCAEVALTAASMTETRASVYLPETDPHRPEQLSLMSDMRAGLTRGEFQLVYQPKLDLKLGRITGAEALVRWRHPTRGQVMPDDFISMAEQTGNIQNLTRWALRAGLAEAGRWRDQGLPARVAINLSVRDLADETLPNRVGALLRETQLSARSLVLEVTESAIMGEPDAAIAVLRRLDEQGIDLAIDDFGVGQSSLAYLRRLPVREIKLDKAFILKLPHSPDDQSIVRSVTELGHNLGYRVTAEGVEEADTLRLLREYDCDHAQGYFIGRPMAAEAFMATAVSWRETMPVNGDAIVS